MASYEFAMCSLYAEKQVQLRRKAERENAMERGTALVAAMLAEGDLIDEVLEPLKLGHLEKLEYIAKHSVFIKAVDGHEAVQVIWAPAQVICIHRLLSKEFRSEFQAYWLGVWIEPLQERSKEALVDELKHKVSYRELMRANYGVTSEIQFAASPAVVLPSYVLRQ